MFSVIVAPEQLGTGAPFAEELEAVLGWVLSENEGGSTAIMLAGMPALEPRTRRLREGIPIDATMLEQIASAAINKPLSVHLNDAANEDASVKTRPVRPRQAIPRVAMV
jgi:LDH2 family malate/lactate/ureidoglycolate dehydrogenase